jgi:hypothetical protein
MTGTPFLYYNEENTINRNIKAFSSICHADKSNEKERERERDKDMDDMLEERTFDVSTFGIKWVPINSNDVYAIVFQVDCRTKPIYHVITHCEEDDCIPTVGALRSVRDAFTRLRRNITRHSDDDVVTLTIEYSDSVDREDDGGTSHVISDHFHFNDGDDHKKLLEWAISMYDQPMDRESVPLVDE